MKRSIIIIIIGIISSLKINSQDIHFSQYNNAPLDINPANTGNIINGDYRCILNYKNQWSSIPHAYKTYNFSYDRILLKKELNSGYLSGGINILQDVSGETNFSNTNANISFSYNVPISSTQNIIGGIQAGIIQQAIDESKFKWDNQYIGENGFDQSLPSGENITFNNTLAGDLSGGILWSYLNKETYMTANNFFHINVGIAGYHLNRPLITFYNNHNNRLYSRYVIHCNSNIGITNTNLSIMPSGILMFQREQKEILVGSLVKYNIRESSQHTNFISASDIAFGGHYRINDAIILEMQFEISGITLGLSYDINISKLKIATQGRGGLELSLIYKGSKKRSISKY